MKFALQVMGNQPEGKKDISKEYLKGETGTDDPKGDTYPHNPNFFKDKCWWGYGENGTLCTLLVGMQNGAEIMENSMEVPHKIKNRTTTWFNNFTLRCFSERIEISISKTY